MKDERLFDCVGISGCTRGNVCDLDGRCGYAPGPTLSQQLVADTVKAHLKDMTDPQVWTATLTGPDGDSESICTRYPDVLLKWLIAHSERFQVMTSMKIVPGAYASPGDASEMRGSGFMPMPPGRTYCDGGS